MRTLIASQYPHRVLSSVLGVVFLAAAPAAAQHASASSTYGPAVVHSMHQTTVPAILAAVPGPVLAANNQAATCMSSCFTSTTKVRANTRWQLQVALARPLDGRTVECLEPGTGAARSLAAGVYQAVATGDTPTFDQAVSLTFLVSDPTGKPAAVGAGELETAVSYRVVALP